MRSMGLSLQAEMPRTAPTAMSPLNEAGRMDGNLALNDFRRRTSVSIFAVPGQHSTPPEHDASDDGGRLLTQISDEMVRAKKEFFGRGPTKAKSYVLDD